MVMNAEVIAFEFNMSRQLKIRLLEQVIEDIKTYGDVGEREFFSGNINVGHTHCDKIKFEQKIDEYATKI